MTSLVILDFDGTLADTQPLIIRSLQGTIAELGLPARTDAECASIIGLPLKECFVQLTRVDDPLAERCCEVYRRLFDKYNHPGTVTLFPHVEETLHELYRRGFRLAVCSSRARATLEAFVRQFGLEELMAAVVSADDVRRGKPFPDPAIKVLELTGSLPEEALMVGDASYDILMGRAAGCLTCGVTYGNQSATQLREAGADWLINDFMAILDILK
ncbi:MAG: HAD family hydrolase [bacterium]